MPTLEELLALPYNAVSAENAGLTADAYRKRYVEHGETVQFYARLTDENGVTLSHSAQTLADDVRVLVTNLERSFIDPTTGALVDRARATIWVMPQDIEVARGDRIVLTSTKRAWLHRSQFTRSGSSYALPYRPVASVAKVYDDAGTLLVEDTDYEVTDDGITFLTNAVAVGERFVIHWRAFPTFEVRTDEVRQSPVGMDSQSLPIGWNCLEVNYAQV